MTTKKLNDRQARWTEILAEYNFVIQHCKRKDNAWANILSRRADFMNHKEMIIVSLLEQNSAGDLYYCEIRATNMIAKATEMLK